MLHARLIGILGALLVALGAPHATAQCAGGVTLGQITLPNPAAVGTLEGQLIIGHTGPTVYKLSASLKELPPTPAGMRTGTIEGILFDANAASFILRGRWFANALGQGFFRCVVIELGPGGQRVGRVGGKFPPPPGPLAFSQYEGAWVICP